MRWRKTARLISQVLDPLVVVPLSAVLALPILISWGLTGRQILILGLIDLLPTAAAILYVVGHRDWRDWDIHARTFRAPILLTASASQGVGLALAIIWQLSLLVPLLLSFWLITLAYWAITNKWKVSIHTGVISALAWLAVYYGGWQFVWVWCLVPLVGWARVVGHEHTFSQVTLGALLPPIILELNCRLW